jgi:membrane protein implicated in regulation of membrane protease activity
MGGRGTGRKLSAGYYLGLAGIAGAVGLAQALRGSLGPAALIFAGVALLLAMAAQAYRRDRRL